MSTEQAKEYFKQYRKTYTKKRISLTVSPKEFEELQAAAKTQRRSISGHVKQLAFDRLNQVPVVPALNEATAKEVSRLVRTMANNLNQIAHHLNASRQIFGPGGHIPPAETVFELQAKVAILEHDVRQVLGIAPEAP